MFKLYIYKGNIKYEFYEKNPEERIIFPDLEEDNNFGGKLLIGCS